MVSAVLEDRTLGFINVADIRENPDNPRGPNVRQNDKRFDALRESVALLGVLVPLVVQDAGDGTYRLIDGERRYHVAKALRIRRVPAIIVHDDLDSGLVRQTMFQIHTNWSQWDAAMQCHALEGEYASLVGEYGDDVDSQKLIIQRLAERTGDDQRTVRNRVQFLRWPTKIKEEVYARKHLAYWYIVEIEDKIIEPARKNYPAYFKVVEASAVRTMLFRKFEEGLVRAAVEVRRAGIITRTQVEDGKREVAVGILRRLAEEVDYSFEEAREEFLRSFPEAEQEPPPSPRVVLNQVRKLLEALDNFSPGYLASASGRGRVDRNDMVEALADLQSAVEKLRQELETN